MDDMNPYHQHDFNIKTGLLTMFACVFTTVALSFLFAVLWPEKVQEVQEEESASEAGIIAMAYRTGKHDVQADAVKKGYGEWVLKTNTWVNYVGPYVYTNVTVMKIFKWKEFLLDN